MFKGHELDQIITGFLSENLLYEHGDIYSISSFMQIDMVTGVHLHFLAWQTISKAYPGSEVN